MMVSTKRARAKAELEIHRTARAQRELEAFGKVKPWDGRSAEHETWWSQHYEGEKLDHVMRLIGFHPGREKSQIFFGLRTRENLIHLNRGAKRSDVLDGTGVSDVISKLLHPYEVEIGRLSRTSHYDRMQSLFQL